MKKLTAVILILALACAALPASAEEWADYHCSEMQFSTKIPVSGSSGYEEGTGLRIYLGTPGYIPYVQVTRRPLDMKFSNPVNYLNNVYREYLEEKYKEDSMGMNPARKWEAGGRELLGAKYMFRLSGTEVTQILLLDIRDAGDVEFTAKFYDGNEEVTMAALEEAVRYYREDGAAAAPAGNADEPAADVLEPLDRAGEPVDTRNGTYQVKLADLEHIDDGGFFTVELYTEELYPAAAVEVLKPGDRVKVNGAIYTVKTFAPWLEEENVYRLEPEEGFDGWLGFEKAGDDTYCAVIGNWHVSGFATDVQIMLPLANDFRYVYEVAENDVTAFDADRFIQLCREGDEFITDINPRQAVITFKDGLAMEIYYVY